VGLLAGNRGIVVKAIAGEHESARALMLSAWRAVRREVLNTSLPRLWKR
jgi:hypothetical protein